MGNADHDQLGVRQEGGKELAVGLLGECREVDAVAEVGEYALRDGLAGLLNSPPPNEVPPLQGGGTP
jgi:hypothetical protein